MTRFAARELKHATAAGVAVASAGDAGMQF
jgi:hypothetical protein